MRTYTYEEVRNASLDYFKGDGLAADVFAGKYALQDLKGNTYELTPVDMHRRLAREFARAEAKYPNPMTEDEIFEVLADWQVVPQGGPMSAIGNAFQVQSLSNCFVIESPYDSYGGIMKADQEQVQIMKRRGGVGFDISSIRPQGQPAANAARTTDGIGVFMERYSNTCREVAQGGRRGALMLTLSVHHPDVLTFANIKRDRQKVTGANVSIRMTDEFMQAVKDGGKYQQRFPVERDAQHVIERMVDAREVWNNIVAAMRDCSEPGMLFWDAIKERSPADAYAQFGYGTVSTNPCIVGNTLIAVADGRNAVSIKQLAEEGVDIPVYSTNPTSGRVEIKWGRAPRLTKRQVEVWKLTLDDGSTLVATPDHRIMLCDRSYVELRNLKQGDSVFPFNSFNSNGYRQVCNTGANMVGGARRNCRQYRLIHEFFGGRVDPKTHALHHVDFDSTNDAMSNLRVMLHEEHRALHAERMMGDKNPYHTMTDEWKVQFARHLGEKNGRYSGVTNEQLLEHGRHVFELNGRLTNRMWIEYAKANALPQFMGNEFRFGSWKNFANQVATNHKVVSVEHVGVDDVYNITVDDNHNYHVITSHDDEKFVVSSGLCVKNCGEITLSPYDSCRLLLINLSKFVKHPFTPKAKFDYTHYGRVVQKAQRMMDDLIDLELEAVDGIINKIKADPEPEEVKRVELELWLKIRNAAVNGRRTGLGITALGDTFAYLNLAYGSDESIRLTEDIYKALALNSYRASVVMAQERGPFPIFSHDVERNHPFIRQVMDEDPELRELYERHGRRNIANTTTAPAGSTSIETQTSSGCEPVLFVEAVRYRKINPSDKSARVDRIDDKGDKWQSYKVFHHGVTKWMEITGETDASKSPYHGSTVEEIDWLKKIDIQAAAQKWICHSISNTTNLPKDVSVETVEKLCWRGWETGCKGVTIYRIGSRDAVIVKEQDAQGQPLEIVETHAPKRPKELPCDIHRTSIQGENYLVLVGLFNGRPYEIFAGLQEHVEVPKKVKRGVLIKNGKNKDGIATYNLRIPIGDDDEMVFKDIVNLFDNPNHGALTRTVSLALRHGAPIQYLVEQLRKDKHSDFFSFSSVIARTFAKNYIQDGTRATIEKTCNQCGGTNLQYQQGCITCFDCGNSKCG
jgi:ribonucleotide reductase alpha subunit